MRSFPQFAVAASVVALALGGAVSARAEEVVTLYSADGLHDGQPNWYQTQFDAFTKATGIKVQYVEGGSGGVVERIAKEASNPQADVLVTLPPFIMKAAAEGMLQTWTPTEAVAIPAASKDAQGRFVALCNNYMNFIYDKAVLGEAPKTFDDLLDAKFKGKIQYSTPGQAGDGTAVMIQVFHAFGSKEKGFAYLKALQGNNVGPSASTGKLTALVNKGELHVANGDMQMNIDQKRKNPNIELFWPAGPDGKRSTFALPYYVGLVKGAPHAEAGKKLIDFLLAKEAQGTLPAMAWGIPVRSDVKADDANAKAIEETLKGVEIWTPDWDAVLKDLSADVAKWHEVTGS